MHGYEFYVDPSRCIGCQACVQACAECETHRGTSLINFDFIDRPGTAWTYLASDPFPASPEARAAIPEIPAHPSALWNDCRS